MASIAELAARDASRKVRGGAPFLPHVVNSDGATVTEAAQVAEVAVGLSAAACSQVLQSMQQQTNKLQQQLHRTPDTGVQQRLDAIQWKFTLRIGLRFFKVQPHKLLACAPWRGERHVVFRKLASGNDTACGDTTHRHGFENKL